MPPQKPFDFADALPRPLLRGVPPHLMKYTTNLESFDDFQLTGYEVYTMLDAAALKHGGKHLHEHASLLDFGCGAGRIMQFIPGNPARSGCDVNAPLTEFVQSEFKDADIYANDLSPPLKWPDRSFDLVYSFSVFSHLPLDNEMNWLRELKRVGKPGCLYLITIHGDWFIEAACSAAERAYIEEHGFHYKAVHQRSGNLMDFPENYEASYHTSAFIRAQWGTEFEVLEVYKGNSPQKYCWDGMPDALRSALSGVRSMGQDLVVLRNRG